MYIKDILNLIDAQIVIGDENKQIDGCYIGDLLSLAMSKVQKNNIWITIQSNINIVAVATLTEAACILVCEGFLVDENVLARAETENITILKSDMSAFEIAKILISNGL